MTKNSLFPAAMLLLPWGMVCSITLASVPVEEGLIARLDASQVETWSEEPPVDPPKLVTAWTDRSGRGNHAAQGHLGDEVPTFVPGVTPAGGGAVMFDGSRVQYLEIPAAEDFNAGVFTWYVVFRPSLLNNGRLLNSSYADVDPDPEVETASYMGWGSMPASNGRLRSQGRTTTSGFVAAEVTGVVDTARFFIGGGSWDPLAGGGELTSLVVDENRNRYVETASGANGVPSGHLFSRIGSGSSNTGPGPSAPYSGEIAEVLVYDRILSAAEQSDVEDYLHSRHLQWGGGGTTPLGVTGGLILWLDAQDVTLVDPEPEDPITRVTQWTDLSGRGNHAAQGPLGHEYPRLIEAATPQGGNVVRFDGSTEYLEIPGNPMDFDGDKRTWYVVLRPELLNNGRVINSAYSDIDPNDPFNWVTNYATWGSMPASDGRYRVQGRTAANGFAAAEVSGILDAENFAIGGAMWDSEAGILTAIAVDRSGRREVGTLDGAGAIPTSHIFTRIGAGSGTVTPNPNAFFSGDVAEILIYNRLLTEEEQAAVEAYLREKHLGIPEDSGFDLWLKDHFTEAELADPDISGPGADPMGEGVPNLLRYAFGLTPWTSRARAALPLVDWTEEELTITYARIKDAPDLEYVVQVTGDFIDWFTGPDYVEEISVVDDGEVEIVTVRAKMIPGDGDKGFLRLLVLFQSSRGIGH